MSSGSVLVRYPLFFSFFHGLADFIGNFLITLADLTRIHKGLGRVHGVLQLIEGKVSSYNVVSSFP